MALRRSLKVLEKLGKTAKKKVLRRCRRGQNNFFSLHVVYVPADIRGRILPHGGSVAFADLSAGSGHLEFFLTRLPRFIVCFTVHELFYP